MAEALPDFSTDPFTQVYVALWNALFDPSASLGDLVAAANRTDLSVAGVEIPSNAECANLPGFMLAQADWSLTPSNSKADEVTQAYPFRAATSVWSVRDINAIKWAALKALKSADASDPNFGFPWVRGWTIRTAGDSAATSTENRGEEKWTTVGNIVVTMCIPRASFSA
jgi:hypothetical protein